MNAHMRPDDADEHALFEHVTTLARSVQAGKVHARRGFALDSRRRWVEARIEDALFWVEPGREPAFAPCAPLPPAMKQLLELYLPLCLRSEPRRLTIAHLGQSLDGRIATENGESRYVTGQENLVHVHRLRALCDAVLVGASTVELDDPQLTTRLVCGRSPVRVVIDPRRRLSSEYRIFQDASAPTWLVCARNVTHQQRLPASVEVIEVDGEADAISPEAIVLALNERGVRWLFLEGGGVTVSRFLMAGVLDRMHLTIAPVVVGAGVSALSLPALADLTHALRPRTRRFLLGDDVLFDCELERGRRFGAASSAS